jgi:TRAP-type mannitol/chloroaromatic compound transport system substrate-binding protein
MINLDKWNELPKRYQLIITGAAAYANSEFTAKEGCAQSWRTAPTASRWRRTEVDHPQGIE